MKTHENRALFSRALLKATTCLFLTAGAGVSSVWATPETTESMRTEMVQQQTVTVSGVVKDRKGEPIIGANIMEKGTTNGTITDFDGKYTLKVKNAKSILVVSYIGYQTQEIPVGNGGKKDITMQDDSELMDEVVVIGYGTQRKGDVTSAISSVKSESFVKGAVTDAGQLFLAHHRGQLAHVLGKAGLVDVEGLIRAEGGSHGELDGGIFLDLLVPVQVINGVIGGADEGHVALLDQAADGQFGIVLQLVVAQVPHFFSGVAVQHAVVAEENVQLQIGPVVHGVANGHGQSLCKLLEALAVGLITGDVLLGHTVGTHHAPLIMVAEVAAVRVAAAQPHLSDVLKAAVLVDLAGRDVAVIVADGHSSCIVVIQMPCGSRLEHEVLIHKCFHGILTPFL